MLVQMCVCVQKNLRTRDRTIPFLTRFKKGEKSKVYRVRLHMLQEKKVVCTQRKTLTYPYPRFEPLQSCCQLERYE